MAEVNAVRLSDLGVGRKPLGEVEMEVTVRGSDRDGRDFRERSAR